MGNLDFKEPIRKITTLQIAHENRKLLMDPLGMIYQEFGISDLR